MESFQSVMLFSMTTTVDWRGAFENEEINHLHAEGFHHAFIADALVSHRARGRGIGQRLVAAATGTSKEVGCEWLHVDFEEHLETFYSNAGGFRPTKPGLIRLR